MGPVMASWWWGKPQPKPKKSPGRIPWGLYASSVAYHDDVAAGVPERAARAAHDKRVQAWRVHYGLDHDCTWVREYEAMLGVGSKPARVYRTGLWPTETLW
jgi:hypothetical protein